ncbi:MULTISPECIES: transporter substrate-binding domain-containing protein [Pseudomonas]|nr:MULTISPECIES: transporter substrate-binding domain-containing protein [Pseudomonas]
MRMKWWVVGLSLLALDCVAEELKIGFGTHKPPYVFERENRGLEYDVVIAAARAAGFTVKPYYSPMERLHRSFSMGEIDAMTTTNPKGGVARFYSQPYIHYQNVAMSLASRGYRIESIADLRHYSVRAFQRARFLLGDDFRQMAESNPRYHEEAQQVARNRLLYSGRVDVVIGDRRILHYFNREVYAQVDVGQPVTEHLLFPATAYHLGLHDEALRDRFDRGLAAIRASGEYAEIERRYAIY